MIYWVEVDKGFIQVKDECVFVTFGYINRKERISGGEGVGSVSEVCRSHAVLDIVFVELEAWVGSVAPDSDRLVSVLDPAPSLPRNHTDLERP
jgi:hypothetical protein